MGRARIVDVDYHQFRQQLMAAGESDGRIEPSDKQRWKAYVREHDVKEASCMSYARGRNEKISAAIINNGGSWDGYYVYSEEEEFCLKFERGQQGQAVASAAEQAAPTATEAPSQGAGGGSAEPTADAPSEQAPDSGGSEPESPAG